MYKIFLVRHGQSVANLKGIYQGQRVDTDLTDLGVLQAQSVKKRLSDQNITNFITSPLKRAVHTAKVINNTDLPTQIEAQIAESDHGDWSSLDDEQIKKQWPNEYDIWLNSPSKVQFPNGEHFANDTAKRVLSWWHNLNNTLSSHALVTTHENILQILACHIFSTTLDNIWKFRFPNCSLSIVSSNKYELFADTTHLSSNQC